MSDTIEDILAIEFAGNWQDDRDAFKRIDDFIMRDDTSMQDKIKASRYCDVAGTGEGLDQTDADHERAILEMLAARKESRRGTLQ